MSAQTNTTAWKRLGGLLERRRVALDPRYKNLAMFADERGINYRLAWDIESGARTNYRRPTLRAVEVAYGLPAGAIDAYLDSGVLPGDTPPPSPQNRELQAIQDTLDELQDRIREMQERDQLRFRSRPPLVRRHA